MDRRILGSGSCNGGGGKNQATHSSPAAAAAGSGASAAATTAGSKQDAGAGAGERKALLPRHPAGGMARKGPRGPKRRVQWKDSHGKKLVEVLEFQPSDSSDSDDEYLDTCICSVM